MDLPKPAGQLGTLGAAHNQQHHGHQNGHHSQQHQNHGKPYSQGGLLHQHNQQHQQLTWGTLRACLLEEGECISEQDLDAYLAALTGGDSSSIPSSQVVDPKFFAEQLLGFEDFSDNSAL